VNLALKLTCIISLVITGNNDMLPLPLKLMLWQDLNVYIIIVVVVIIIYYYYYLLQMILVSIAYVTEVMSCKFCIFYFLLLLH